MIPQPPMPTKIRWWRHNDHTLITRCVNDKRRRLFHEFYRPQQSVKLKLITALAIRTNG